ncbi:TerC family protein [Metabacillus fastidiosus]|uniref:TerC family protein n=1 Tax=Metabacillus fastidiosus TaxID=1458 RepID=UPI002E1AAE9D|nr:TerC family protein [Metabacillus fastidiosus]
MELSLLLEYGWVLLVLIALEGILSADNALVMAIMVKHLPEEQRKKALFYGLAGAFVLRFGSLFIISFLVNVWQVQAIGALYLLFLALNHIFRKYVFRKQEEEKDGKKKKSGFWVTVLKVELVDIAFAVDSILAAVALALTLPKTNLPQVGGLDGGQFAVIFLGGIMGLIIMRVAANFFVKLLHERPSLETAAFLIVGWVGVKLGLYTLAHIHIIPEEFIHSGLWKTIFWVVLAGLAVGGFFLSKKSAGPAEEDDVVLGKAENQ